MLNLRNFPRQFLVFLASLSITGAALADDTDIYTTASAGQASDVDGLIMLIMESRPNTGSALCSDVTASGCRDLLGDEVYDMLMNTTDGLGITTGKVYLSDALRAVYLVLLPELVNVGNFHIGVMNNHNNDNNCTAGVTAQCSKGAYVLRGMEPISDPTSLAELLNIIRAFPRGDGGGSISHPYQANAIYEEYYRYLTGGAVWNGVLGFNDFGSVTDNLNLGEVGNKDYLTWDGSNATNGTWKTPLHNLAPDTGVLAGSHPLGFDKLVELGRGTYVSPFSNANYDYSCAKVFAFNNTVGSYDPDGSSDNALMTDVGGLTLQGGKLEFSDVVSRFYNLDMASADRGVDVEGLQNVTSYFLIPDPKKQDHDLAVLGGTGAAFDTSDPKQLLANLRKAFNDISTRSSTLVAASVPVNVFNRSDIVNNVFLAIFEVNDDGYPFWPGNLKKLKLQEVFDPDTGKTTIKIVGANGLDGFNPLDGRISTSATTFWTDTADLPTAITDRSELSGRDGRSVTMGGAGQNIPGYSSDGVAVGPGADNTGTRKLYIGPETVNNVNASGNTAVELAADSTAAADPVMQSLVLAQGATATELETNTLNLLRWLRGMDPVGLWGTSGVGLDGDSTVDQARSYIHLDTNKDGTADEWRRWMLGDALHSLPLTINYGNRSGYDADGADNILGTDDDNPDIRIFMGTNDGIFHQFKNTTTGASESGAEIWGFMPRTLMDNVAQLATQAETVPMHPYGVDGVPVAFVIDNNSDGTIQHTASCTTGADNCDKVYVYFGLRRGGKAYYALDVSDPDAAPKVLWRIRKPEAESGTGGSYDASAYVFNPGMDLIPGKYNEGTLTIGGTSYAVRHNTSTEVVLGDALPGTAATGVTFTLTSPGESDFAEMGMTFSTPRTAWVKYNDTPTPVLIFAGGYHGGWNPDGTRVGKDDLANTGADSEGAAIYIVHARTGELIWKAVPSGTASAQVHVQSGLSDSIPSGVATLDSDGNDITDRLYVGDTGGTVWRVDLPENPTQAGDTAPATSCGEADQRLCWFTSKFATLGDVDGDGGTDDRRFFHAPRIVQAVDANNPSKYDAVVMGSGDRAHPKSDIYNSTSYVQNYFFVLKDRKIVSGDTDVKTRSVLGVGDLKDVTNDCLNGACSDQDLTNGWKMQLEENGEKNLSSPLVVAGNVFFTTYLPEGGASEGTCVAQVGNSRLYIVSFRDARPVFNLSGTLSDSGLGKSDRYKQDVEGIGGDVISLGPKFVMTPGGQVFESGSEGRSRTYWRDKGQDQIKH